MITVSAKALWWHRAETCYCADGALRTACARVSECDGEWPAEMLFTEIDGWQFLTDRYVLMPTARLAELPVGYDRELNLKPLPRQASQGFAEWLTASVVPAPSHRLFQPNWLDPLEEAGFKVRELVGVKEVHGICDGLEVVGLIQPIMRSRESDRAGRAAR